MTASYRPLVERTAVSFETTPPSAEETARRMLAGERRCTRPGGFRPVGTFPQVGFKHGRWHDTGWWWPLGDPVAHPAEPRAWDGRDPA